MASEVALRDENFVTSLLLESNATPGETLRARGDESTGRLLVDLATGGGDVSGPGSSTDDAVVRWNGTTGMDIANSTVGLSDAGILYPFTNDAGQLGDATHNWSDLFLASGAVINWNNGNVLLTHSAGLLTLTGAFTASGAIRSNTSLILEETGAGTDIITIQAPASIAASYTLTLPIDDGDANQVLTTDGSGVLSWSTPSSFSLTVGAVTGVDDIQFSGASVADNGGGQVTVTITPGGSNTQLQYNNNGALGGITGATTNGTVVTLTSALATTAFSPSANDAATLGSSGVGFSDLFLASGGVINWAAGDATITHSAGLLTFNTPITSVGLVTGAGFEPTATTATGNRMYLPAANTLGFSINGTGELQLTSTALSPISDDGLALGTTALGWTSLFGDTGFVINIENGDWVATHTAGILTVGTGDLRVTTAGTNTASVVTVGGAQTLTSKTITNSNNVLGGVTMTLGSDANGDIYYRASSVLTRIGIGTAGQVLTVNAGATAPEWADAAGGAVDVQSFTGSGTWNKPSSGTVAYVRIWGGGGGGGGLRTITSDQAAGGGGGGYNEGFFLMSALASTVTVTIGGGGGGADELSGSAGGTTTFGALMSAFGGGGGGYGDGNPAGSGGGGSALTAGGTGSENSAGAAGNPLGGIGANNAATVGGFHGAGGGSASVGTARAGGNAVNGGGGGGSASSSGSVEGAGGTSNFGGAGGAGQVGTNGDPGVQPGGGGGGKIVSGAGFSGGAGGAGMCVVFVW